MKDVEISPWSLLLWPVALPTGGFMFILQQLRDTVNEELFDPEVVRQHLLELQLRYESGEVAEEEYRVQWSVLEERLASLSEAIDVDE